MATTDESRWLISLYAIELCLTVRGWKIRSISGSTEASSRIIIEVTSSTGFTERNQNNRRAGEYHFHRDLHTPRDNPEHIQPAASRADAYGDPPEGVSSTSSQELLWLSQMALASVTNVINLSHVWRYNSVPFLHIKRLFHNLWQK